MNSSRWNSAVILLLMVQGCSSGNVAEMRGDGPPPAWEDLQTFEEEPLRSVAYPMDMGDSKAAKAALLSDKFSEALSAFEGSALPDGYSDKQAQKDAMVQAWKAAVESAKSGSQDELKASIDAARKAQIELHK